jgi:CDP-glucose 4,6-dehydratase
LACEVWVNGISPKIGIEIKSLHEAKLLRLNVTKAAKLLDWKSTYGFEVTVSKTIEWYRAELAGECMKTYTEKQIVDYFYGD